MKATHTSFREIRDKFSVPKTHMNIFRCFSTGESWIFMLTLFVSADLGRKHRTQNLQDFRLLFDCYEQEKSSPWSAIMQEESDPGVLWYNSIAWRMAVTELDFWEDCKCSISNSKHWSVRLPYDFHKTEYMRYGVFMWVGEVYSLSNSIASIYHKIISRFSAHFTIWNVWKLLRS